MHYGEGDGTWRRRGIIVYNVGSARTDREAIWQLGNLERCRTNDCGSDPRSVWETSEDGTRISNSKISGSELVSHGQPKVS